MREWVSMNPNTFCETYGRDRHENTKINSHLSHELHDHKTLSFDKRAETFRPTHK